MTTPQTSSTADSTTGSNGVTQPFSQEVVAFAAAHHGEHCLQPLLEATHRIFPTARFVKVSVENDPELRDNTQIVFHVQVVGLPLDQARVARRQWNEEATRLYPPLRKFLFCLQLDLWRC
jgi:3-deoxy-D-manno-octulosonic-acid transferase